MNNILTDSFQRPLKDLRISVTDRCNMHCIYCSPKDHSKRQKNYLTDNEYLSNDEFLLAIKAFQKLGVHKVRITGGEPLLRKDIVTLVEGIRDLGIKEIALTTNGVYLDQYLVALKNAGLKRLNISLDALDDTLFQEIVGSRLSNKIILDNILHAKELGFLVKVNMVVIKGINDNQILPMVDFFKQKRIQLRFIEFMDVGNCNEWNMEKVVSKQEIYELIKQHYSLKPASSVLYGEVAKRYVFEDDELAEIGFISSVTESFCSTCTRGRLSSNGVFYTCLFASSGLDLKPAIKKDHTDELVDEIKKCWSAREDRYSEIRHLLTKQDKIEMSFIGG